uniref:Uncharacterized protein n=1 Tax=Peronospora matthiolae TaxID=2874970 RepID=A0AAV1SZL8_9STRA
MLHVHARNQKKAGQADGAESSSVERRREQVKEAASARWNSQRTSYDSHTHALPAQLAANDVSVVGGKRKSEGIGTDKIRPR